MKKILSFLLAILPFVSYAQDNNADFEQYIIDKYTTFNSETDKIPKYTKEDLSELLKKTPLDEEGKFSISEVVNIDGQNKDKLYDAAYQYIVDAFVNANNVVQMKDKESGIIVCKGRTSVNFTVKDIFGISTYPEDLLFTLKLQFKDGRYKIQIYNLSVENTNDESFSFETLLLPDHYVKKSSNLLIPAPDYSSKYYANARCQLLTNGINHLMSLKRNIKKRFTKSHAAGNDW